MLDDARKSIYWDACVWLSYINEIPERMPTIDAILDDSANPDGDLHLFTSGKCSDSGVPGPFRSDIAPIRLYYRREPLIGESQEWVARAKPLTGDVGVSPTIKFPLLLARRRGPGG